MVHNRSYKDDESWEERHERFQGGTNPMKMTAFEEACVAKEVHERTMARTKYVEGIQGRDGGCIYPKKAYFKGHDDYESDPLY